MKRYLQVCADCSQKVFGLAPRPPSESMQGGLQSESLAEAPTHPDDGAWQRKKGRKGRSIFIPAASGELAGGETIVRETLSCEDQDRDDEEEEDCSQEAKHSVGDSQGVFLPYECVDA